MIPSATASFDKWIHPHPTPTFQVIPYNQRIALFLFKLQEALAALGRLDHAAAIGFAMSMSHDAAALHNIVRRTRNTLSLDVQCFGGDARARWWLLPSGAAVLCIAMFVWRAFRGSSDGGREKKHVY
jgi:hypothetical protein